MKKVTILLALAGTMYTGVVIYLMSIMEKLNPFEWTILMFTLFLSLGAVAYGCNKLDENLNNK